MRKEPYLVRYLMNIKRPKEAVTMQNAYCTTCGLLIVYCFQDEEDRPGPFLELCAFCNKGRA